MHKKLLKEQKTLTCMVKIYCFAKHEHQNTLCNECKELFEYAASRLNRCIYGEKKPVCARCTVHCYKQEMRNKIKQVMRYSGKRMLIKHPVTAMQHLFNMLKY